MRRLLGLWLLLCSCAAGPAWAAPDSASDRLGGAAERLVGGDEPLEIQADVLEYESRRRLYTARGSVEVRRGERTLRADWAVFSDATRRGAASGDVVISDGRETLYTTFVEFEAADLEGVMFDARFASREGQFEMSGAEIAKTGERTYHFRDGTFTTCRCPDPEDREPWRVTAEEADLELEGYGTARNTTFEVLGVPVVWLPWMLYPLKTERQSGLLFPELDISGRNGFEVGLPVFWAAGDPLNVIATPRWLQKRGPKGDLDLEYVLGRESEGRVFGAFLHDFEVDDHEETVETPFTAERWATTGRQDLHLPGGWRFKTRYAFISDNAYPQDFGDELSEYRRDRFLPAEAFATRSVGEAGALGLVAGAGFADDLQNPDDTDRDDFLLQRLPAAQAHALPRELPFVDWLVPALDVRYAWYQQRERPQGSFDPALLVTSSGRFLDTGVDGLPTTAGGADVEQGRDGMGTASGPDPNLDDFDAVANPEGTEGDGFFQEGELLADQGHRALLTPRLGAPVRVADLVELYPELGWHETLYGSDATGFERRGFLTGRVDLRTRLRRRFAGAVHLLEPRLGWAYAGDTSQGDNPLFVPGTAVPQQRVRTLALENVTRDWADRIREFNGLTFGFGNRLLGSRELRKGGVIASLLADFTVSGQYDFAADELGPFVLDGTAELPRSIHAAFNAALDPDSGLEEALLAFGWRDQRGDRISVGYRFLDDVPEFFEAFPRQNERFDGFRRAFDQVNQIDAGGRLAITEHWAVTYRGVYSFERSLLLTNVGGVEYISQCSCWAARVELTHSRSRGPQVRLLYRIVGLGEDTRDPFRSGVGAGAATSLDAL